MVNIRCPFCEMPVETVTISRHGTGELLFELYAHEGGETHFVLFDSEEEPVKIINVPVEKGDG